MPDPRAVSSRLVVDDVTVRFAGLVALDSVSFTVEPGELHAVIGPNGAGKSTCFNVVSGVYRPTSGEVRLGDEVISGRRPHEVAGLGVARAFQNVALSKRQTVRDYLMVGRHHLTRSGVVATGLGLPWARQEHRWHAQRVLEIAEFMGLADKLDVPAGLLAYGDQKRVDIARAIAMEPQVLVLDEPAAGMDSQETRHITGLIRDLRRDLQLSVLLVEHDMGLVMSISDSVTVLDFGRRIASGTPAQVQRDPEVVRAYLGGSADPLSTPTPREEVAR
ncbi:ABC transporter ATP-binding protein [Blastococcus sp. SYSU DS0533]